MNEDGTAAEPRQQIQEYSAQGIAIPLRWKRIVIAVWSGQAISFLTSGAAGYALMWYLVEATGSTFVLALSYIAVFLPMALLGPIAGTMVDRINRKHVMIAADLGIALTTVVMAVLIMAGHTSIELILGMMLIRSIGQTFHQPAMAAVVPLLVPDRHLVRIASLDQILIGSTNIVSPALGIFMYASLGLHIAMFADALGAIVACVILLFVFIPDVRMDASERTGVINEMKDGFRAVRDCRGMGLFFLFMTLGSLAFMPMAAFFPLMTYNHFALGGYEAAIVEAVWGGGFLVGSVLLGIWGGGKRLIITIAISIIVTGAITLACGMLPPSGYWAFVVLSGFMAIAGAFFNGPSIAVIQRRIAPEKLGRAMALFGSLSSLAAPIGLFVAGPAGDVLGVHVMFIISGVLLVVVAIVALIPPAVRSLDDPQAVAE